MADIFDVANQSVGQAVAPNASADVVKTAIGAAQLQNQVTQQQQDIQATQDKIDTARYNQSLNSLYTLARTPPQIAQRMVGTVQNNLRKAGIDVDPAILQTMASDDSYKSRMLQSYDFLSGNAQDPASRLAAMQSLGQLGDFDKGLDQAATNAKAKAQQQLEQVKGQNKIDLQDVKGDQQQENIGLQNQGKATAAQIAAQGKVAAVQAKPDSMGDRVMVQAGNQYKSTVGNLESGLGKAHQTLDLMGKIDAGDLNTNSTLRNELTTSLAQLINQGKAATVHGTQSAEFNSAYQGLKDKLNYLTGSADSTMAPDQFDQMKKDVSAIQTELAEQHSNAYNSMRQGLPDKAQGKMDARYSTFRRLYNLPQNLDTSNQDQAVNNTPGQMLGGQAPAAGAAPAPAPTSAASDVTSKIQIAASHGYKPADVAAKLGRPLTPQELALFK